MWQSCCWVVLANALIIFGTSMSIAGLTMRMKLAPSIIMAGFFIGAFIGTILAIGVLFLFVSVQQRELVAALPGTIVVPKILKKRPSSSHAAILRITSV